MGPRLSPKTLTPISPPLKRRLRNSKPDLLSPPTSAPNLERPSKRRKTRQVEDEDQDLGGDWESEGVGEDFYQEDEDSDPLRPPQFWDNLRPSIPLVTAALEELDRRNRKETSHRHPSAPRVHGHVDLQRYARHGGPDLSDLRAGGEMPNSRGRGAQGRGTRRPGAQGCGRGARGRGKGPGTRGRVQKTPSRGTVSHSRGEDIKETSKGTKSGPYDAAFKQHLINHKIRPIGYWYESGEEPPPPDNLDAILHHIKGGRASLEPEVFTQNDFTAFRKSYQLAASEEAQSRTLELVEGLLLSLSSGHIKRGPVKFANLRPLTPDSFVPGFPDRVYGSRPEKLHRAIWQSDLDTLVLPTVAKDLACPNFIVHIKGPSGHPETANIQAVYDGALAARSMEAMWLFGNGDEERAGEGDGDGDGDGEPARQCPRHARTLTCTFAAGALRIYAVHIRPNTETPALDPPLDSSLHPALQNVEYITTLLGAWFLDASLEDFRRGATAYRNAIEWSRIQREEVIARANCAAKANAAKASGAAKGSLPVLANNTTGSFSSVDELA